MQKNEDNISLKTQLMQTFHTYVLQNLWDAYIPAGLKGLRNPEFLVSQCQSWRSSFLVCIKRGRGQRSDQVWLTKTLRIYIHSTQSTCIMYVHRMTRQRIKPVMGELWKKGRGGLNGGRGGFFLCRKIVQGSACTGNRLDVYIEAQAVIGKKLM